MHYPSNEALGLVPVRARGAGRWSPHHTPVKSQLGTRRLHPRVSGARYVWLGLLLLTILAAQAVEQLNVDVCVYGGTSGGVIAAVQAARMGKTVALVAQGNHLGGMTASGLGWTDIGHVGDGYIQGVAREFYTRIGQKYGTGFKTTFEPHVAEQVFNELAQQAGVLLYTNQYLVSATKFDTRLVALRMNNGNIFRAKEFVDATYTGDLLPAAGVSYTIGRESTTQYGESLNGVRAPNSDFTGLALDPYLSPGNPASGLLPLIQSNPPGLPGAADDRLQAYSFRLCLTTSPTNKIPITAPANYSAAQFELLGRYCQALQGTSPSLQTFLTIEPMPNGKTDINNAGALSLDFVGQSRSYVEADAATRAEIWQAHKDYTQGFLYFLATDPRVPPAVRSAMSAYGYAKDEFVDTGGWPWELYVREARRMVSDYVMTQSNVFGLLPVPDSIGLAGYFTDSHYCQRVVLNGSVRNEGSARGDITQPYPVAYRALVPRTNECVNLLVPWALSASHTAFSSLRMEPVFMILAQAAGTAAAFAIDDASPVQTINIAKLQAQLMADHQELGLPPNLALLVDNADPTGVATTGSWTTSTATAGYYGPDYWHDGNTNKGLSTVTFTPTLPLAGLYQVFARWTAYANRATNVPVDILSPAGTTTLLLDQTHQGGQWVPLLLTNFNAGTTGKVRLRTTGTTGFVVADAVQFVQAGALPVVNLWAQDALASRWRQRPATLILSRTGPTNLPLTVSLSYSGTARNGLDFPPLPTSITFPPGLLWTNLTLRPFTNAQPVGTKTLALALAFNPSYTPGPLTSATLTISDLPIFDWRLQYFGANAANPAIAADAAAPAGDGIPNLVKYALGLDPTQTATNPLISATITTNGFFQASYLRRDPPPLDIIYRVEAAPDLAAWGTNGILTSQIEYRTNATAVVICQPARTVGSRAQQFLRLIISRY